MPSRPGESGHGGGEPLPVFVRRGDARSEIDRLVAELGTAPEAAGLHKYIYAAKADQTVVMVASRSAPLAGALRGRAGWIEPVEGS